MVNSNWPASVGVPDSLPVVASSVSPGGTIPAETLKVIGAVPLVTKSTGVIAVPTMPLASGEAGAVIEGATAFLSSSQPVKSEEASAAKAMADQVLNARMRIP